MGTLVLADPAKTCIHQLYMDTVKDKRPEVYWIQKKFGFWSWAVSFLEYFNMEIILELNTSEDSSSEIRSLEIAKSFEVTIKYGLECHKDGRFESRELTKNHRWYRKITRKCHRNHCGQHSMIIIIVMMIMIIKMIIMMMAIMMMIIMMMVIIMMIIMMMIIMMMVTKIESYYRMVFWFYGMTKSV